ncbi:MAG TPA: hypothetical protein VFX98_12880, partial [Longimicrobiaceae bacterium]|nr:hypothetical protein [Longimicrobiaceae bacterium]
ASGLLGVALLLAGAPWWVAVGAFLVVYNALHLWLRVWGLRIGLRDGLEVGKALKAVPLQALGDRAGDAGAALAGFSAVLMAGRAGHGEWWQWALGALAVALGVALGTRVRPVAFLALLATVLAGLVLAGNS